MSEDSHYKSLPAFTSGLEDWPFFKLKFSLFLEIKELLYVIQAEEKDTTATQEAQRKKDDLKVRSFLMNKLGNEALQLVTDSATALQMMAVLETQYASNSVQAMVSRFDRLLDMEYKGGSEISTHIATMTSLVNQLKQNGELDWNQLFAVLLLRSMPKSPEWNGIVLALKTQEASTLTRDRVCHTLIERANELYGNGKSGVKAETPQKTAFQTGKDTRARICDNCGKTGHDRPRCWAKGGGDEGGGPRQRKDPPKSNQPEAHGLHYAFVIKDRDLKNSWIMDSGATQHYTFDKSVFSSFTEASDVLKVADGNPVEIKGHGSVLFSVYLANGASHKVTLKKVFYAPKLMANLISVSKLDKDAGLSATIQKGVLSCSLGKTEVLRAPMNGPYYMLDGEVIRHQVNLTAETWHARLGCLNADSMRDLGAMVDGYAVPPNLNITCDICAEAKSTRGHFSVSTNPRAKHPLDLVHMDTLVINSPVSRKGERYALVLIDDYSECKFALPMVKRSDVTSLFQNWLGWAERMTNRKLKCIRSDNAKEFKEGSFAALMKGLYVEQQFSVPYEHEQNGKAERAIRTLLEKARCILLRSKL